MDVNHTRGLPIRFVWACGDEHGDAVTGMMRLNNEILLVTT